MLKKILAAAAAAVVAKVVIDKLTGNKNDAELWAEATDSVQPSQPSR